MPAPENVAPGEGAPAASADGDERLDEVAAAVLDASRALVGVAVRSMVGALESLTLQQYRALVLVGTRGPQRVGALAEALGIHPSTFSRAGDRLVAGGWVERTENPEDRREVLVALTDAGRAVVEEVMRRRRQEVTEVLRRVPPRQRGAVLRGMHLFAAAAGEASASDLAVLGVEATSASGG